MNIDMNDGNEKPDKGRGEASRELRERTRSSAEDVEAAQDAKDVSSDDEDGPELEPNREKTSCVDV